MSQRKEVAILLISLVVSMAIAIGVVNLLKGSGLHYQFLASLPDYKIDGILVLMAAALALNYRGGAGQVYLFNMLVGAALMIGCHLVLNGLPDFDQSNQTIKSAYAIFGSFFYVGIVTSLTSACMGLYRRDKREPAVSRDHT